MSNPRPLRPRGYPTGIPRQLPLSPQRLPHLPPEPSEPEQRRHSPRRRSPSRSRTEGSVAAPAIEPNRPVTQHAISEDVDGDVVDGAPTAVIVAVALAGVALAVSGALTIHPDEATSSGALSVLSVDAIVAPILVAIAFGLALSRRPFDWRLTAATLAAVVAVTEFVPLVGLARAGTLSDWVRAGLVDSVDGAGFRPSRSLDTGLVSSAAALWNFARHAVGMGSARALSVWVPLLEHLALFAPAVLLARRLKNTSAQWAVFATVAVLGGSWAQGLRSDGLGAVVAACVLAVVVWHCDDPENHRTEWAGTFVAIGALGLALLSLPALVITAAALLALWALKELPDRFTGATVIAVGLALVSAAWQLLVASHSDPAAGLLAKLESGTSGPIAPWHSGPAGPRALWLVSLLLGLAIVWWIVKGWRNATMAERVVAVSSTVGGASFFGWGTVPTRALLVGAPFVALMVGRSIDESRDDERATEFRGLAATLCLALASLVMLITVHGDIGYSALRPTDVTTFAWVNKNTEARSKVVLFGPQAPWVVDSSGSRTLRVVDGGTGLNPIPPVDHVVRATKQPTYLVLTVAAQNRREVQHPQAATNAQIAATFVRTGQWTVVVQQSSAYVLRYTPGV